ncbi:beta-ketoacyl synthase N-terminal-like domain-containing protein [Niveibacterium terrae]|uniref:beta-ketoacyl synthase N-terminal-like domain-containing protein n=1 Tax=Niveibacterium terrae TaxID=3373598 RepID=UPI003A8DFB87
MRILARALASAGGADLAAATDAALAARVPTTRREGRRFGAIEGFDGAWPERLAALAKPLFARLRDVSGLTDAQWQAMPLFLGSSSHFIGWAETSSLDALPLTSPAELSAHLADLAGLRAHPFCFGSACVASLAALDAAVLELASRRCQHALVLGLELGNRYTREGFASLGLLGEDLCRPLDRDRDGLMLGEALAGLILSRADGPGWRVSGRGWSMDASGPTAADLSGAPVAAAIAQALARANCPPEAISLIKLHGAGSPLTDGAELAGLRRVFKALPPCVSLKPVLGHCLGASGIAELNLISSCLDRGEIPPTAGFVSADPDLDLAPAARQLWQGGAVLGVWLGFGGQTAALVLESEP